MVQDDTSTDTAYQVLARKYRPQDFSALIGQEAMVRVLKNAFETGRIHHAYVLTGVRGIGKTTTARIIAKGLNCIGKDGKGGPTVEPCGECEHCTAITDGRHVDVIELDAASHTGIDDVREIIEGAKYRPAMARYKVYIIDETHMLSKNAFNGLLKTLEEPPEHVKFLFATTEIRKMPVTVLSRCQRFDLRRIAPETLSAHLAEIAEKEGVKIEESALALIARAAEGSVRDAQSLLDQAIADGAGDADTVRRMLGLADRGRVLSLFGMVMRGEAAEAIAELRDQYRSGAEPQITMAEMADSAHWLSTLKISPELGEDPSVPPELSAQAGELAASLQMKVLARAWQMLLKALEEVSRAPSPIKAAEMAIIRLCSVADMPPPGDLVKQLTEAGASGAAPSGGGTPSPSGGGPSARASGRAQAISTSQTAPRVVAANPTPAQSPRTEQARDMQHLPQDFDAIIALIREKKDGALLYDVETGVKLVDYAPGKIEFEPVQGAPSDLPSRLSAALKEWTGERWFVTLSDQPGAPTIAETRAATQQNLEARIKKHPLIAAALMTFPKAEMRVIPRKAQTVEDLPEDDFDDDEDLLGED